MKWFFQGLLLILFFVGRAPAQKIQDEQLHKKILSGIDLTVKQEYAGAYRVFASAAAAHPAHPAPFIYWAGALQAESSDNGREFQREAYDSLLDVGEANAEKMIRLEPMSPDGYYYAGTVLAYRAYTASEGGNWAGSIYQGINAAKQFEKALELNPKYYDAMNGLGTYYYWRSTLTWVPFIVDRRAEGISMVMSAARRSVYEQGIARNNLMLILIEEKRYAEAEEVAAEMLSEIPNQRSFLWGLVTLYEQTDNAAQLKQIVPRLLASVVAAPIVNYYNEAACRVKVAQYAYDGGEYTRVLEECGKVLDMKKVESLSKKSLRKKYTMAEDLISDARNKLGRK